MSKSKSNKQVNAKASLSTGSKVSKGTSAVKAATKAPKTAKPATEGGRKGRAPAWPLDAKIKVLAKENPKRAGSASFDRFALYSKNATVGDFLAAGGTSGDLHWDSEHEYISIG